MSLRENKDQFTEKLIKHLLICLLIFPWSLVAQLNLTSPSPFQILLNANAHPSLVNSVDFHPILNQFCITFTHNNCIAIYQLDEWGKATIFQLLEGKTSKLSYPQHALFSKDGRSLVAVNWYSQTFTVYNADMEGHYKQTAVAVIPFQLPTKEFRPHGMAFSPDGNYLAVAFGASKQTPRGVAVYSVNNLPKTPTSIQLLHLLRSDEMDKGIPKGVAFSPDGSCLLITLSETNSVAIYRFDSSIEEIISNPLQILNGTSSQLSRPEDIKFSVDGKYCAISNSNKDTVTFYSFDKENNVFLNNVPEYIMENPEAQLSFPHGLAFSPDGKYLAVTQFGPVVFDDDSNLISWGNQRKESVNLYKMD